MRDDVDDALSEPELLHARVAAIRRGRRFVGARLREVDAHVAPAVAAGRHLRPDDAAERLVARKRAGVVERLDPVAEHRAVGFHRHLDVQERALVAVRVGRVLVGAPLRPLHGPVELSGEQAQGDEIRVERDLVAEPAADVLRHDAELVGADPQRRRHPDDPDPGHLMVAVQSPLGGAAVVLDEGPRALERRRREAVEVEAVDLDDVVGLGQRLVEVAPLEGPRPDDVRAGLVVQDRRPASTAVTASRTGSSGSYSTSTSSAASRASSRVSATTAATARRRNGPCRPRARSRGSRSPEASTSRRTDPSAPPPPRDQRPVPRTASAAETSMETIRRGRTASGRSGRSHAMALDVVEEDALALHEPLVLLTRDARARKALLRGLDLIGRDGRHAGTSPRAAASIASTMFT